MRDCLNKWGKVELLCIWCGPSDHEDIDHPKQKGINMLDAKEQDEAILAIIKAQSNKVVYPKPRTKKERLQEAKEVEQAMENE